MRDACKAAERVAQDEARATTKDLDLAGKCYFYLNGAEEMLRVLYAPTPAKMPFCVDGIILRQKAAVFARYVDNDPTLGNIPAAGVYLAALGTTYPCAKK